MANGDAAAAAGMDVVPGTADRRLGYDEINKTRDYIAQRTSNVQPVVKGGTGATDAVGARANLSAMDAALLGTADLAQAGKVPVYNSAGRLTTADPLLGGHAASKQYADGIGAGRVAKSGDTMSGDLFLPGATPASTGYAVAYINGDGRVSKNASSERFKDDITPIDPASLGEIFPKLTTFTLKADPGRMQRVGYIAERLNESDDLRRFVVYERVPVLEDVTEDIEEPVFEDVLEDVTEPEHDEEGQVIGEVVVGQRVVGQRVIGTVMTGQRVVGQRVIGSTLSLDEAGNPVPESIDFIALLMAQVAQLHRRVEELESAR